ncbi:MAG: vitamin B12 dependent-methionine synthase activation domain-containing protein, partial [bacterium]
MAEATKRSVVEITVDEMVPAPAELLQGQGMPADVTPDPRITALRDEALVVFRELATPKGLWQTIDRESFATLYVGEGENASETPVAEIFPRATDLALFVVTLGPAISDRISALFAANEFPLAAMLDAAASAGAEHTADVVERHHRRWRQAENQAAVGPASGKSWLRYSPGYCGWHVSGQRALFAALQPETIGITLRPSCLMEPLKSISGVIIGGPAASHLF